MLANSLALFRFQSLRADSGWNRENGNYMEESEGNKKNHPVKVKLGGLAMVEPRGIEPLIQKQNFYCSSSYFLDSLLILLQK